MLSGKKMNAIKLLKRDFAIGTDISARAKSPFTDYRAIQPEQ